jgi:CheY-like chemotaxis protein
MAKLTGKHILIVDDEADLRDILVSDFELEGARVDAAENGTEAFKLFQKTQYDFVLSDIRMPNGDGITLLKMIQQSSASPPPVFLITGFADIRDEDALRIGAKLVIAKPFVFEDLLKKIIDILAA